MEPCLNMLNGMHQILSFSLNYANVEFATAWVAPFYSLVRTGLQILGADERAVEAAFAWMDEADDQEPMQ